MNGTYVSDESLCLVCDGSGGGLGWPGLLHFVVCGECLAETRAEQECLHCPRLRLQSTPARLPQLQL